VIRIYHTRVAKKYFESKTEVRREVERPRLEVGRYRE
jgi:hypothetical protein